MSNFYLGQLEFPYILPWLARISLGLYGELKRPYIMPYSLTHACIDLRQRKLQYTLPYPHLLLYVLGDQTSVYFILATTHLLRYRGAWNSLRLCRKLKPTVHTPVTHSHFFVFVWAAYLPNILLFSLTHSLTHACKGMGEIKIPYARIGQLNFCTFCPTHSLTHACVGMGSRIFGTICLDSLAGPCWD